MIELCPVGRGGTPDEVGAVGALLMGPEGTFITGSDFLMDGGVTAPTFTANLPHSDRHRTLQEITAQKGAWAPSYACSNITVATTRAGTVGHPNVERLNKIGEYSSPNSASLCSASSRYTLPCTS